MDGDQDEGELLSDILTIYAYKKNKSVSFFLLTNLLYEEGPYESFSKILAAP